MYIIKSPFRISLFGGSTDYKDFYEKKESFIIGTTIDKYVYMSLRQMPKILPNQSTFTYSGREIVTSFNDIKNPLIREVVKYYNIPFNIEFTSFTDIPSRTGLGGSSSFCVGLCYVIRKMLGMDISKKQITDDAIFIERTVLKESGGIQDQIWASYGGINSIQIDNTGKFLVKPLPITSEFKKELESSMILIYSNEQRNTNDIATSHENKEKDNILQISKEAYNLFLKEDIKNIGLLLYESWMEKKKISDLISNSNIDSIINRCMELNAYGAKLLGSGGCGFILVMCNESSKSKIQSEFKDIILDFKFESNGVTRII